MKSKLTTVPYGEMEGLPCLSISLDRDVRIPQVEMAILSGMRSGVQAILFEEAPWGTEEWDNFLLRTLSDPRLQNVGVMAIRPIESEKWSSTSIYWICDASSVLAEARDAAKFDEEVLFLGVFPRLTEAFVRDPAIENLKHGMLDALYQSLDPEARCWLYLREGDKQLADRALRILSRCTTPWGLRTYRKGERCEITIQP